MFTQQPGTCKTQAPASRRYGTLVLGGCTGAALAFLAHTQVADQYSVASIGAWVLSLLPFLLAVALGIAKTTTA